MGTMTNRLLLVGAGGQARVVMDTLMAAGIFHELACITDDNPDLHGQDYYGIKVKGGSSLWPQLFEDGIHSAIVAVGDNKARRVCARKLQDTGFSFPVLIHPQASVSPRATLGAGTVVFAGAVVQIGAQTGSHVIINTSASVDHDCKVGDYVHIAPGSHLSGHVAVGDGSLLGVGSSVIPGTSVGQWSVIGAGSAVVNHIADYTKAYGNPAREVGSIK